MARFKEKYEVFRVTVEDFLGAGKGDWRFNEVERLVKDGFTRRVAVARLCGWYWWCRLPGCMPEGDAVGPYPNQKAAEDALIEQEEP